MNTINGLAGIFTVESDEQIIKKNGLRNNSEKFVQDFVKDLSKVKELARIRIPQEYKEMTEWSNRFLAMYNLTQKMNSVSPLLYFVNYCKETNSNGDQLMSQACFLPKQFQIIFAKHFVGKR